MMIHFGLYSFPNWSCHSTCFLATDEQWTDTFIVLTILRRQFKVVVVISKLITAYVKLLLFPVGGALPILYPLCLFITLQYFGTSLWSIFVFNNLINLGFSAKFVITWHVLFLDNFWISQHRFLRDFIGDFLLLQNPFFPIFYLLDDHLKTFIPWQVSFFKNLRWRSCWIPLYL